MLSPLLALALVAQTQPMRTTFGLPAQSAPAAVPVLVVPILAVNDTVDLVTPSAVAVDTAALGDLLDLLIDKGLSKEAGIAKLAAMIEAGRMLEIMEPTRMVIHSVTTSDRHHHTTTGQSAKLYTGQILDGPHRRQTVVIVATQVEQAPQVAARRPPTAEELAAQEAADKAERERIASIYREVRTAKNAAKAKAAAGDLSVRKQKLARATTHWRGELMKKHHLDEAMLDAIIARGEELDGTADRLLAKNVAGKERAKAANDQQLMVIGAMIDQAGAQFLANQAAIARRQAAAAAYYAATHPNGSFYLPEMGGRVVPGKPWATWAPTFSSSTKPR